MEIKLAPAKDKIAWNDCVLKSRLGNFLQSWQWGNFQEALGNKVFRIKIVEEGKPKTLMEKYKARNIEEVFIRVVQ